MNNLEKRKNRPIAWKPNDMRLKTEAGYGLTEYLLFTSIFIIPIKPSEDNVMVEIDIKNITDRKLKGSTCTKIRNAIENVSKWQLEIPGNGRTKYKFINIFCVIERHEDKIIALLNKEAIPLILEYFSKGFTKIPIKEFMKLSTFYQAKTLELCERFKKYKKPIFDLVWLKSYFGIPEGKYNRWPHLKKRVIDPSFSGINSKTSFKYSFKEIKRGNKVIAIRLINGCDNESKTNDKCEHDKEFEFASDCFNQLSPEEKKDLLKGSELFQDEEFKVLHAIEKFRTKYKNILVKCETTDEVLITMKKT